ncbi:MAG: metallophosphoesterase [Armatimonadota bacterium]
MPTLHILHTADLHNKLTPAKAAFIRDLKTHFRPNVLLLDAGDAIGAGNLGARGKEPVLTLLAEAGYDAMAMGNRESHPTRTALRKKLSDAHVPVLAANMRYKQDRRPPAVVQEYVSVTLDEDAESLDIDILGLAPQITSPTSWWAKVTDYIFDDPLKTGFGLAKKLRPTTELIIALTHLGYALDVELCASPDIDLVIGGHSHQAVCPPERHGHAYLATTDAFAVHIGHVTVEFTADQGIIAIQGEMIPLP